MLRYLLLTVTILGYCASTLLAQAKDDYVKGQLLVKFKPDYTYLNADGAGMRNKSWNSVIPVLEVNHIVSFSAKVPGKERARVLNAGKSGIDLRLYHQISFDPAIPVEEAIQMVAKSPAVALVEPVYTAKTTFVPNDPMLDNQYYADLVNAMEAWDISKSNENIIIAILDSGVDLNHPDLAANIYRNEGDPINGSDDDDDGYVDNYWGWDFAGADFLTLEGDNDPNSVLENADHGTMVAGCASAVTNNGVGIAGIGFNAQLMVLKHTADNDTRSDDGGGYLSNLLQGVLYAATHGAHIINASYGSTQYSQIAQDIYEYAAVEYDVLIVAAAGNDNSVSPHFPSDYDYVLSVAATDRNDQKSSFTNYGYKVDLSAPGSSILTTQINNAYGTANGTSFAAPIVSGAAALVRAAFPELSGLQVGELLRVTADPTFIENLATTHKDRMGKGRLDIYKSLTQTSPSVRLDDSFIQTPQGDAPKAGEEATLWGSFINFLSPASDLQVTLTTASPYVSITEGTVTLGNIETLQVKNNESNPFRISISDDVPANTEVVLKLTYTAENYTDFQFITVLVNPSFYNINENLVATTVAGNGRIGYQDTEQSQGKGFVYNDVNMLFEMGVIMAVSDDKVVSSVRSGVLTDYDNEFGIVNNVVKDNPGTVADVDVYGTFDDSKARSTNRLNVEVDYRAFAWREVPYEKMIIVEYEVKNTGTAPLEGFYLGLYADWDINQDEIKDKADWDAATSTGYVYTPDLEEQWVGAIQVLNGTPNYWAIDNDESAAGNPFGVYDSYTEAEKYKSLSSGIGREEAGGAEGADVSHTVSSGPYTIAPGESVRIGFALHGGSSVEEVVASASAAKELYQSLENVARPVPATPVTGLKNSEIHGLKVYPNPAAGWVNIHVPTTGKSNLSVRILDLAGKQIADSYHGIEKEDIKLQLPEKPGLYVLEIIRGNKRTSKKLFVK